MTLKQKEIIIKFLSWFLSLFIIIFVGVNNVFGATISDYSTKYYYGNANSTTIYETSYRSGSDNKVTLYAGTAPTYADSETFNGFYNQINYTLTKGSIYTLSLTVSYSNLFDSEWGVTNINNRLLSTDFAHCSHCTITAVSGSIRRYNASAPLANNLYDYVVTVNYTFIATSDASTWYIGSYTGDDRTIGVYEHQYTSVVMVNNLNLSNDNNSTIINQNDTIIDQNNQIIEQNEQNTQDIIDNQNQNAQDIINNQNSNTQQQIESQQVCTDKILKYSDTIVTGYIYNPSNGAIASVSNWGVTDYLALSSLEILENFNASGSYSCFYDSSKTLISCISANTSIGSYSLPNNTKYARFSIRNNDLPSFKITTCKNGNQAISEQNEESEKTRKGILGKLGDIFSTLFSDDDADVSGLDNMVGWLPPGPVDSIINLPLSLFNSLTNTLSGTCTPVTLTLPFVNKTLTLPCFDAFMSQYLTGFSTLWNWVGITVSVFILYRYLLSLYKWIDDTLTMRENNLPGYYDDNMWGGA